MADAGPPTGRWFRLNTTWSQSEWVAELEPAARLAWIELLGYVKAHGFDGRCRTVSAVVFGRMFGIPTKDAKAMLEAAHADGALETDGDDWVITGWKKHQGDPTAAKRMRRYREKQGDGTVTDVTRNDRNVTPTETKTKTDQNKKTPSESKKKEKRWRVVPEDWEPTEKHEELAKKLGLKDFDHQVAKYRDHEYERLKSDPNRTFNNWLRNAAEMKGKNGHQISPAPEKRYHRTPAEIAEMFPDD